jgi:hypothetical protein
MHRKRTVTRTAFINPLSFTISIRTALAVAKVKFQVFSGWGWGNLEARLRRVKGHKVPYRQRKISKCGIQLILQGISSRVSSAQAGFEGVNKWLGLYRSLSCHSPRELDVKVFYDP